MWCTGLPACAARLLRVAMALSCVISDIWASPQFFSRGNKWSFSHSSPAKNFPEQENRLILTLNALKSQPIFALQGGALKWTPRQRRAVEVPNSGSQPRRETERPWHASHTGPSPLLEPGKLVIRVIKYGGFL